MINIIENLIIPDDSVQKYLSLSAFENGEDWFGNGVVWAGASQLTAGHKVYRQCCEQHLVYFCLEGEVNYRCDDFVGVVKPGHMLFIPAGYEHHFQSDRVVSIWFMLDPRHSRWEWLRSLQAKASISISENELKNLCEIIYIVTYM